MLTPVSLKAKRLVEHFADLLTWAEVSFLSLQEPAKSTFLILSLSTEARPLGTEAATQLINHSSVFSLKNT